MTAPAGPAFTVLRSTFDRNGGLRLLLRARGGRVAAVSIPASRAFPAGIEAAIAATLAHLPNPPNPD